MKQLAVALASSLLTLAACTDLDDDTTTEALAAELDWETELAIHCPGVDWTAGVPSYRGLAGTYVRLGLPAADEPYRLSFATLADHPDAVGTFAGLRGTASGVLAPYAGAFRAITDNPAIGAALGLDVGADGRYDATHFVLGLRRSFSGATVTGICLTGLEHPFLLIRTF